MKPLLIILLALICAASHAQDDQSAGVVALPANYTSRINKKISGLDNQLDKQSEKYLKSLSKQEEKIFKKLKKLGKLDSISAASALGDAKQKYTQLSQKLNNANGRMDKLLKGKYLQNVDSLATSLGFLKNAKNIVSSSKNIQEQLGNSLEKLEGLQAKLNEAENIQQFIRERQQQLKQVLSNYSNIKGLSKHLGKYQQQAFYYSSHINELKESFNQPDKLVAKTLALLQKVPAFQKFWQRNSMIAAMFPTPDNADTPAALTGLQTRASVQQVLQQQLQLPVSNNGVGNPAQLIQQQLQQAQGELSKLKDKLGQLGVNGSGSSDMAMPAQKINPEKTKPFLKRIQLGATFQSQRATNYFPTTTDIALTAAYKLNEKGRMGIGLSGKVGWGNGWKHIHISGQGVGARAFVEWKAPDLSSLGRAGGGLWFYAGAELNYNRTIKSLAEFKNYSNYSKNALAGLSKKYSMNSPLKKGKKVQGSVQVLYDFLHARQVPRGQALVWRVGYTF
ncbi:MAG: hypothetical protein ACTHLE_17935 [Agriterribacter sp.]